MQSDIASYNNDHDFLTTRQVLDILKVDRITVYRMLQDGRLKGVKIGQQWRFPRSQVERLLGGLPSPVAEAAVAADPPAADNMLPVHCLQTIQNLFTHISQINAVLVDLEGSLLTQVSAPGHFCRLMLGSPNGRQACQQTWRSVVARGPEARGYFTCHAGFDYIPQRVVDSGFPLGWIIAGPLCVRHPEPAHDMERLRRLAAVYGLPLDELQQAAGQVRVISPEEYSQVESWVFSAAQAMESILRERSGFLQRLQQIANLTQLG